jgi:hypothetical protein
MASNVKVGTYTGTGAAINIPIGWVPDFLIVFNYTDGDIVGLWANGMAAGTSLDIAAAAASNADNAVTAYAGSTSVAAGVTVGTDWSENAKVMYYLAVRNLP